MFRYSAIVLRSVFMNRGKLNKQSMKLIRCLSSSVETPSIEKKDIPHATSTIPKGILGQPTCHTHPHMVEPGCLTSCVTQQEYIDRRDNLVTKLASEVDSNANHVIIIPGAVKRYMSDKIPYVFRQNSDFFYLSGCLEPGAILVMMKEKGKDTYTTTLFVNEKDEQAEMWEGPRTGTVASAKLFAVNESLPIDNFEKFLQDQVVNKPVVVWYQTADGANSKISPIVSKLMHQEGSLSWADPQRYIQAMRVIKSHAEIELMKETCYIGAQSMNMAMACTRPGMSEHDVSAILDFTCRQAGAEHLAFPPVVAGGPRSVHIHYVTNNQLLKEKEMLLVDAGSQRWLYNSDLSRTWPVSGKFSPHQKILYEIVLSVQKRLIRLLGEHRPPLDGLFDQMCRLLGKYMQQEGILPKDIDGNELAARAYRLCPHHVSHYLGLDVHDSPLVRRSFPVQTGMVVTVEPGLYIRPDDTSVPQEFRGVGIRIEDDILITDNEALILTDSCAKEIADIESLVGKHSRAETQKT